jgi:hypothetical protein
VYRFTPRRNAARDQAIRLGIAAVMLSLGAEIEHAMLVAMIEQPRVTGRCRRDVAEQHREKRGARRRH